jgi:hypothetical protein
MLPVIVAAEDNSASAVAATAALPHRLLRCGGGTPERVAGMSLTPLLVGSMARR